MNTNHDALREAFNAFLLEQHERHKHQHNHFHAARSEWARRTQSTQYEALAASKPEPQAQAGEPIKMPQIFPANTGYKETTMCCRADEVREAIAKKDAALDACVEAAAKAIYEQWESHSGYVAWVEGGNSLMQEAARSIARAAITKIKEARG